MTTMTKKQRHETTTHEYELDGVTLVARGSRGRWRVSRRAPDGSLTPLGRSRCDGSRRAALEAAAAARRASQPRAVRRNPRRRPAERTRQDVPGSGAAIAEAVAAKRAATEAAWATLRAAVAPPAAPKNVAVPRKTRPPRRVTAVKAREAAGLLASVAAAEQTRAAVGARRPWAVSATTADHAALDAAAGELGEVLSAVLRDLLGDRAAGRVRKAMRAHGLITAPIRYEFAAAQHGRVTVAAAPLSAEDAAALPANEPARSEQITALVAARTRQSRVQPLT